MELVVNNSEQERKALLKWMTATNVAATLAVLGIVLQILMRH
jgi:hypothetical protein